MNNQFAPKVTSKGTELPLLNLRGKPYLQVAHRLVWFREEYPQAKIITEVIKYTDTDATVKATIVLPDLERGVYFEVSTAHKHESVGGFPDYLEKAETGAIGRALAMAGYGTQFEPEFDEGERLVDSPTPVARKEVKTEVQPVLPKSEEKKSQKATNRAQVNESIRSASLVLVGKKKKTQAELQSLVETFGAKTKEELSEEKAKELLTKLKELINE